MLSGLRLVPVVDMLSDPSHSTLPFDTPSLFDPTNSEEDPLAPLSFDGLLDIASEFEFIRTITHIWPCDEEPNVSCDTGLEDILAAIVPTLNAEESFLPLPSATHLMTLDPVHVQEIDLRRLAPTCPASDVNANIYGDLVHPSKDDDQVRVEAEPPTLRGWSPPNGSQFLDLDDSLILPQSPRSIWTLFRPAAALASSCRDLAGSINQLPVLVPAIGDPRHEATVIGPNAPPTSTADRTANDPAKNSVPPVPLPVLPSTRHIPEPTRAWPAPQTNSNVPNRMAAISRTKAPKPRPQPPSTLMASDASTPRYAKAPKGGVPPHIARTVTKANILLVEKERKVIRDAHSGTTVSEKKKPSVLRRAAKVEKESGKNADGGSNRKQPSASDENEVKEERSAKRVRV